MMVISYICILNFQNLEDILRRIVIFDLINTNAYNTYVYCKEMEKKNDERRRFQLLSTSVDKHMYIKLGNAKN
jgi:hypothetical protein